MAPPANQDPYQAPRQSTPKTLRRYLAATASNPELPEHPDLDVAHLNQYVAQRLPLCNRYLGPVRFMRFKVRHAGKGGHHGQSRGTCRDEGNAQARPG